MISSLTVRAVRRNGLAPPNATGGGRRGVAAPGATARVLALRIDFRHARGASRLEGSGSVAGVGAWRLGRRWRPRAPRCGQSTTGASPAWSRRSSGSRPPPARCTRARIPTMRTPRSSPRLARGDHARTAYLSLNRGEGGQNIIGLELFDALGVLRTEELLQARALDGGEQFFTQRLRLRLHQDGRGGGGQVGRGAHPRRHGARHPRSIRPLVVLSRFTGTPADGHGQHQLAG